MTPLEIIVLIIGIFTIFDIFLGIAKPKKMKLFLEKKLGSKSAWMISLILLIFFLVFGYFINQQLTLIQIIPGLFLGVLLTKMVTTSHSKEVIPILKNIYEKTDWFAIIVDLLLIGIILWALFM